MTAYQAFSVFMLAAGGILLVRWLAATEFGTKALDGAVQRRSFMPDYFPFAVILGWLVLSSAGSSLTESLTSETSGWQQKFIIYSIFVIIEIVFVVLIVLSARKYFENGLYGFGLGFRGIFRDIAAAAANFIAVWPLMLLSLYAVLQIGKLIVGPEFQMDRNEGLTVILEYNQLSLRILTIFFAAILTPIFEELIFRGLLQNYLRNLDYGPWLSIFMVSIVFSALHPLMHFPAIFVLSVCMGYAYEKSGSLVRSMLIHCFFNASMIAFALLY